MLVAQVWIFWMKDLFCEIWDWIPVFWQTIENSQIKNPKRILLAQATQSLLSNYIKLSYFSVPLSNFKNSSLPFSPPCYRHCFLLSSLSPVSCSCTVRVHQNALQCVQRAGDVVLTSCVTLESVNSWKDLTVQFACLCRTKWYYNK